MSYQRIRKKMIRAGIPVKKVDKCKSIGELQDLINSETKLKDKDHGTSE